MVTPRLILAGNGRKSPENSEFELEIVIPQVWTLARGFCPCFLVWGEEKKRGMVVKLAGVSEFEVVVVSLLLCFTARKGLESVERVCRNWKGYTGNVVGSHLAPLERKKMTIR